MYLVHIERDLGVQIVIYYLCTVLPLTNISHGLLTLRVVGELRGVGCYFAPYDNLLVEVTHSDLG